MSKHSFVVLTDYFDGIKAYDEFMLEFRQFLLSNSFEVKKHLTGPVYTNERGMPMWNVGYEKAQVRESWRFPTACLSQAGYEFVDSTSWPDASFKEKNLRLINLLKGVCDRALELAVGLIPERKSFSCPSHDKEDMCTTHAFQYPNGKENGFSPQLPGILVKEHTDKSMFVAEFCPLVRGLEIYDTDSRQWYMAEDYLSPEKDLILFAGEALANLKHLLILPIEPCLHRVVESPGLVRECFIFEQKYVDYINAAKEKKFTKKDVKIWNEQVLKMSQHSEIEDDVRIGLYLSNCSGT